MLTWKLQLCRKLDKKNAEHPECHDHKVNRYDYSDTIPAFAYEIFNSL